MEKESGIPTSHAVRGHLIPLQGTLASKLQSENQVLFCFFSQWRKEEGGRGLGRVPGFLTSQSQGALFNGMGMRGSAITKIYIQNGAMILIEVPRVTLLLSLSSWL